MTEEIFNFIKMELENKVNTKDLVNKLMTTYKMTKSQASSVVKNSRKKLGLYQKMNKSETKDETKENKFTRRDDNKNRNSHKTLNNSFSDFFDDLEELGTVERIKHKRKFKD